MGMAAEVGGAEVPQRVDGETGDPLSAGVTRGKYEDLGIQAQAGPNLFVEAIPVQVEIPNGEQNAILAAIDGMSIEAVVFLPGGPVEEPTPNVDARRVREGSHDDEHGLPQPKGNQRLSVRGESAPRVRTDHERF
jgi:hypothetical protein